MKNKKAPAGKKQSSKGSRSIAAASITRTGGQYQKRAEKKLEALLAAAAELMARHGYARSSIRDVARATGCSLAGMYYYFKSKEELLFQIQLHTFSSLLDRQVTDLPLAANAEEKLERLVRNHLAFFTAHRNELKVCSYELESLGEEQFKQVEALRREYFRVTAAVVGELLGGTAGRAAIRRATMSVFGMLNWIYMWFDPKRDGSVDQLGEEMISFILGGLRNGRRRDPRDCAADREAAGGTCHPPDVAAAHGELLADGWEYRTTGEHDRIEEQCEIYEDLGFQVKVLPMEPDRLPAQCRGCFGNEAGRLEILLTRHPVDPPTGVN